MTKNRWRRRPEVEGLESMVLLSGVAAAAHHPAAAHAHAQVAHPKTGATAAQPGGAPVQGFYFTNQASTGTGTIYHFFANGRVQPFNLTFATGTIQAPTAGSTDMATGNLHLAARGGGVSLVLTQTPGSSIDPAAGPLQFQFTLLQGTGKYQHVTGTGTVYIQITPFGASTPNGTGGGRIALDFRTS